MVFISHNTRDKDVAREIGIYLVAEDIGVWFDEWEVSAGDSIVQQVNDGLKGCSHFIILWSSNACSSNWVRWELRAAMARAIETGSPRIIPVILDDTPVPDLVRDIRHIRYGGGTEKDRIALIRAVKGAPPSQNLVRAIVRKYHEVIQDEASPFGVRVCPKCGSEDLECSSATDYERDELYYFVNCRECGWSDWTQ